MGLENIPSNGKPDSLNNSWPTTGDPKSQGDDHLRGIKTVLKNFYTDFLALKTKIEGYFDETSGKAKHTINSTKLGGETPAEIRDATKLTGTASADRFPTATVLEPGVMQLSSTLNDDEDKAATPKLVKQIGDSFAGTGSSSNAIGWTSIPVGGGVSIDFPVDLKSMLAAGNIVEVRMITMLNPGYNIDIEYYSEVVFLVPALLQTNIPYLPLFDSRLGARWKINGIGITASPEKFISTDINNTFVSLAYRRCRELSV